MKQNKINFGSIVEIPLPDDRFTYGCLYKEVVIGIFDILTKEQINFEVVKSKPFKAFFGCNLSAIRKKEWPIIGFIPLENDEVYPPDRAYYLKWLPEDSLKRCEVLRKGERTPVPQEYYLSLVKRGFIVSVFDDPKTFTQWIVEHFENWPDYEIPE